MRLLLLLIFSIAGGLYTIGAFHAYREETFARATTSDGLPESAVHPEANLRVIREAIDAKDYTDRLLPRLESALDEAPSFYQPPLLLAAFRANRLELPEQTGKSFEAALARFPSNGRLHLTYGEWLLTPRPTAPYRSYREKNDDAARTAKALDHVARATELEPDLTRQALGLLVRFRVPPSAWAERLPRTDETKVLLLEGLDRAPRDREARLRLLRELLDSGEGSLPIYRAATAYSERWNEDDLARDAAVKWRDRALEEGAGADVARATSAVVRRDLADGHGDRAYRFVRESLAAMEERNFPTEPGVELLCLVAEPYLNHRQSAMAQAFLTEAIALSPYHVPAHLGLARTYRAIGDDEASRRELERVLEMDPSNRQARQELEALLLAPGR
jgi:tetratricopeptide (TPR) repeat protein